MEHQDREHKALCKLARKHEGADLREFKRKLFREEHERQLRFHQEELERAKREELDDARARLAQSVFYKTYFPEDEGELFQDRQWLMGACAMVQNEVDRGLSPREISGDSRKILEFRARVGSDASPQNRQFLEALDKQFEDVFDWCRSNVEWMNYVLWKHDSRRKG